MSSNGCFGCGRSRSGRSHSGRSNFGNCGCCQPSNNGQIDCRNLGPFVAIDADCIIPRANTGSIIAFSSGIVPVVLASVAGGLVTTGAQVGFGTSIPATPITLTGTTIDLTGLLSEAFSVPRTGAITAISASFTATVALAAFTGTATVNAQIYRAPAGSDIFTATGASVDLTPSLTGLAVAVGTTFSGSSSNFAPVPVAVGDRLLMVFTLRGTTVIAALEGNASAGITIT